MDENQDKNEFEPLHKLLELKRYERPPTEFRSEFMAEFRKRRLAEEQNRRSWAQRLWLWLTPHPYDLARRAGLAAAVALVAANLIVLQRNRHVAPATAPSSIKSVESRAYPEIDAAKSEVAPVTTNVTDEVALTEAYYQLSDFYVQAATILSSQNDSSPVLDVTPVSFSPFDAAR